MDEIPPSLISNQPFVRKDRVRVVTLIYKKQDMSLKDFHDYWRDEHSKTFSNIPIVKKNFLTYEQSHSNHEALKQMKELGLAVVECDGIAIFEAPSYEKIFECFSDDDYKKVIVPDEEKFLDRSRTVAFPMDIVPIFDDPT